MSGVRQLAAVVCTVLVMLAAGLAEAGDQSENKWKKGPPPAPTPPGPPEGLPPHMPPHPVPPVPPGPPEGIPPQGNCGGDLVAHFATLPAGTISDDVKADIKRLFLVEKLARDLNLNLASWYRMPIFSNIAAAEENHMDLAAMLVDRYLEGEEWLQCFENVSCGIGEFPEDPQLEEDAVLTELCKDCLNSPDATEECGFGMSDMDSCEGAHGFAELWCYLITAGDAGLDMGLKVGMAAETLEVSLFRKLLERYEDTDPNPNVDTGYPDIRFIVYNILARDANHWNAFEKQLDGLSNYPCVEYTAPDELCPDSCNWEPSVVYDENGAPLEECKNPPGPRRP